MLPVLHVLIDYLHIWALFTLNHNICIFAFFISSYFLIFLVFSDSNFFFLFDPLVVCVWISKYVWMPQFSFYLPNRGDIRDAGSILGSGRSPEGENGNPLQYSCLENPMDRGTWWSTVHGVAKSQTQLQWLSMHCFTSSFTPKWLEKVLCMISVFFFFFF